MKNKRKLLKIIDIQKKSVYNTTCTKEMCTSREVGNMYNNIQKIRKKKNISQIELAKQLKVTQQAVSYMENKDIDIPTKKKRKIAKILDEKVENIFPEMKLVE